MIKFRKNRYRQTPRSKTLPDQMRISQDRVSEAEFAKQNLHQLANQEEFFIQTHLQMNHKPTDGAGWANLKTNSIRNAHVSNHAHFKNKQIPITYEQPNRESVMSKTEPVASKQTQGVGSIFSYHAVRKNFRDSEVKKTIYRLNKKNEKASVRAIKVQFAHLAKDSRIHSHIPMKMANIQSGGGIPSSYHNIETAFNSPYWNKQFARNKSIATPIKQKRKYHEKSNRNHSQIIVHKKKGVYPETSIMRKTAPLNFSSSPLEKDFQTIYNTIISERKSIFNDRLFHETTKVI